MQDDLSQVQRYREIVLRYEALDEQIDALIMRSGGATENMPPEDFARYRQLAAERDDVFSEMRELAQLLQLDDDDSAADDGGHDAPPHGEQA